MRIRDNVGNSSSGALVASSEPSRPAKLHAEPSLRSPRLECKITAPIAQPFELIINSASRPPRPATCDGFFNATQPRLRELLAAFLPPSIQRQQHAQQRPRCISRHIRLHCDCCSQISASLKRGISTERGFKRLDD